MSHTFALKPRDDIGSYCKREQRESGKSKLKVRARNAMARAYNNKLYLSNAALYQLKDMRSNKAISGFPSNVDAIRCFSSQCFGTRYPLKQRLVSE
jgi:hypothetical protein